jgi:hypothetical protein
MLFLLEFFMFLAVEASCPAYTCKLPTDYFIPGTCVFYKSSSAVPTYYSLPCSDRVLSYCPPMASSNSSCTVPAGVLSLKYPGEKCHSDADCGPFSTGCVGQTCQGLSLGQACANSSYCAPGLRCNGTCQRQLAVGESGCSLDQDCENTAGCSLPDGASEGTCITYWSLADFATTDSCDNFTNLLCQSATCSGKQCVAAYNSTSIPLRCNSDQDCGASTTGVPGKCVCGMNRNANMYCMLFYGDKPYVSYFGIVKNWHKSGYVNRCNTERRFSYVCAGDWWDRKQAYFMNYYYYQSREYPNVVEFDQCVGEVFLETFLQTQALLGNIRNIASLGYIIVLPTFILFLSMS